MSPEVFSHLTFAPYGTLDEIIIHYKEKFEETKNAVPHSKEIILNQVNQSMMQLAMEHFSTFNANAVNKSLCQLFLVFKFIAKSTDG